MPSQTAENYLKALFHLSKDGSEVSVTELSKVLEVSKASANSMVNTLRDKGLVNYEKYKPLSLSSEGRKTAALIIRKHRLTEMYLVEKMGFGWEEVHDIAEQIEHIQSPDLFDRMDDLLGHPTEDPHGSPIPDKEGFFPEQTSKRLSSCLEGERVKLVALAHSSKRFLEYLNEKKLSLGTEIRVIKKESFDGSMTVDFNGENAHFSSVVAEKLLVSAK